MDLESNVKEIKGIGDKTAEALGRLGIFCVADLLNHYPRTYDFFKPPVCISQLKEGYVMAVEALVGAPARMIRTGRLTILTLNISDATGRLKLTWYNQPYLSKTIKPGTRYIFRGTVATKGKDIIMQHPQIYTREKYIQKAKELQPVYPLCDGVTNNLLIKAIGEAAFAVGAIPEYLSPSARMSLNLISRADAVRTIHFPLNEEAISDARRRLVFDEFLSFIYGTRRLKKLNEGKRSGCSVSDFSSCERLIERLPYRLTGAQVKAFNQICTDLKSGLVLSRLLEGDVGSGKTIVAALGMLAAVSSGYQACIMAPTFVLAKQHYEELSRLYDGFGIHMVLLTGNMTAAERRKVYDEIKNGSAQVIVGTHAMIQDKVEYKRLAFAVIDEQHRFGVKQREILQKKGNDPYILVMSATPIPRSLAMILYGDMDISVIDEMPKNRLPIKNCAVDTSYRPKAYRFIEAQAGEGHQAYVICPMIEESEELDAENVTDYTERLREEFGGRVSVECLHGKMKDEEKEAVLNRFYRNEISVLVSTTVVEVGINVPNATVMLVENCERFGLSQLHQLKGRVGRGNCQSYCIFMKGYASKELDERLDILVKSNNGFEVANKDLELRGPGDLTGIRQSGDINFKLANIIKDSDILSMATSFINSVSDEAMSQMADKAPDLFNSSNSKANVL